MSSIVFFLVALFSIMTSAVVVHNILSFRSSEFLRSLVPTLTHSLHKGQMGRIGVFGGSREYTGAPYYAAKASLLMGGDLATIYCASEASLPIKCYSPELMVSPWYDVTAIESLPEDVVSSILINNSASRKRLHALVIGPGLGRQSALLSGFPGFLRTVLAENIP
jgi:ATP-dependent NAD(P)H-hydrate dehydratase